MLYLRYLGPRLSLLVGLSVARSAFAQVPAEPPPAPVAAPKNEPPVAAPAEAKPEPTELEKLRADLQATQRQVEELRTAQEEAAAALQEPSTEQEKLKLYGFADMGFQYTRANKSSVLANLYDFNNANFILGNVNIYFDAQPVEHWRGLVEVRFTNAPQGRITNFGGLGGQFARASTFTDDTSGAAANAPLWGGTLVIERAWLEYNRFQAVKLRVGNWFTPFGIWNEDHGSPTLISLAWPQFMTQRWMPLRQTGLMAYGSTFAGSWELGYAATLSNGRQEDANLNIDGTIGGGGRLYARRDTGRVNSTFGLSFFTGKSRDKVVSVTGVDPITFRSESTFEYNEYVTGADVSLDIGSTRIRSEGVVRRSTYTPGKRQLLNQVLQPQGSAPDKWEHSFYVLVAQQLPGALDMFEPYVWAEAFQTPTIIGDGTFVGSAGLNVRFNPAITWKNQYSRVWLFDWLYDSPYDNSTNNLHQFYSRLVMAF
ncbi:MAG: hypothetical protein K0R38_723 [Polyangiaceae bacterium]|jgi:hypothetical protein|nr:hypothetical protein [Polyangiaceae bacterium]